LDGLTVKGTDGKTLSSVGKDGVSTTGTVKVVDAADPTKTIAQLDNTALAVKGADGKNTTSVNEAINALNTAQATANDFAVQYDKTADGKPNKDSVTFASATAPTAVTKNADGTFTAMSGGTSLNNVASAGTISDPANAYKAVNAGDLNNQIAGITNSGLKFGANAGDVYTAKLGSTVNVKGADANKDFTKFDGGNNIMTQVDNTGLIRVALAKELAVDKVTLGKDAAGNTTVLSPSGTVVSNADGRSSTYGLDGLTVKGTDGKTLSSVGKDGVSTTGTVKVVDGEGKTVAQLDGSKMTVGGNATISINDAINKLDSAVTAAGKPTTVVAGLNMVVEEGKNASGGAQYTVKTSDKLNVTSITAGNTTVDGGGLTIKDGPSVTTKGIDAGGKAISNVADAVKAGDAVNKGQMDAAIKGVNSSVTNITNNVSNINTTIGGDTYIGKDGALTDAGKQALQTYDVKGQTTTNNTNVIAAVKNMNEGGIKFFHTNDGTNMGAADGQNKVDSSAQVSYSTAIGIGSVAGGVNSVAMGNASIKNGVAVDAERTKATGDAAIAIGKGARAVGDNSISIGTGNVVSGKNAGAIGDPSYIAGDSSYAIGNDNKIGASSKNVFILGNNVNIGANGVQTGVDANGNPVYAATADVSGAVALGDGTSVTTKDSVALGSGAAAGVVHTTAAGGNYTYKGGNDANVAGTKDAVGVVSVGKEGQTRQIQNVAAGVVSATSTDAINGSQLYYTNKAVEAVASGQAGIVQYSDANNPTQGGGAPSNDVTLVGADNKAPVVIHNVGAGTAATDAANLGQVQAMGNELAGRIDKVERNASAGVAQAIATAGLPQAYLPGKSMMAIGGGYYQGEAGYAVGFSTISDSGNWVIKATGSGNSRGNFGASVGAGYQW
ncbi:YadA family autotransporter adhesin, partial [Paralysiella testudinis]|uniref:YadA family autotransporter adhesin n=1 Tax=Paralysiella testudinis TaxID=2809020 RepID=UPI0036261B7A